MNSIKSFSNDDPVDYPMDKEHCAFCSLLFECIKGRHGCSKCLKELIKGNTTNDI